MFQLNTPTVTFIDSRFQQAYQTTVAHGFMQEGSHPKIWQPLTGHAHSLELAYQIPRQTMNGRI